MVDDTGRDSTGQDFEKRGGERDVRKITSGLCKMLSFKASLAGPLVDGLSYANQTRNLSLSAVETSSRPYPRYADHHRRRQASAPPPAAAADARHRQHLAPLNRRLLPPRRSTPPAHLAKVRSTFAPTRVKGLFCVIGWDPGGGLGWRSILETAREKTRRTTRAGGSARREHTENTPGIALGRGKNRLVRAVVFVVTQRLLVGVLAADSRCSD